MADNEEEAAAFREAERMGYESAMHYRVQRILTDLEGELLAGLRDVAAHAKAAPGIREAYDDARTRERLRVRQSEGYRLSSGVLECVSSIEDLVARVEGLSADYREYLAALQEKSIFLSGDVPEDD